MFLFQTTQNRQPRCASDWIASKRAEKFHPIVKGIGDLRCSDNRCQRKAIADRLPENHDVRNNALRFESPEMRSQTPESDLHFVGNAHCTCAAHVLVNLRQILRRTNNLPADAWQC